jgi:hypothetical protein
MDKKAQVSIVGVLLVVLAMVLTIVALLFILIKPEVLYGKPLEQNNNFQEEKQVNIEYKEEFNCPAPYMKFGDTCCLDSNYNKICDNDEKSTITKTENLCERPYIQKGTSCCLDSDSNNYCDIDEYNTNDQRYTDLSYDIDSPFDIDSLRIYSDEVSFQLNNDESYDVIIKKVKVDDCDSESYDATITSGDDKRITLDCDFSSSVDIDVEIDYIKVGTNETLTSEGRIEADRRRTTYYDNYEY